jgi:GAF domain-containing protein
MNAPADPDRALREAIERQAATAEILEIIASSPTDTQPVFDAIVRAGLRLFADAAISIGLPEGDKINAAAVAEPDPARAEAWRNRFPFPLSRDYMHGVAILDAKLVDIPDVANAPAGVAPGAQNFLASGYRAVTIVPMMRGDAAIGALSVLRLAPGPLSDEQLALLKTFAAQAVIAIENTRLVNELRQRTGDLTESLEQQTAISDILRVISNSPGDVEPVFDAVARHAARICEASFADIVVAEAGILRGAANVGSLGPYPSGIALDRTTFMGRSICDKQTLHVPDLQSPDLDFPQGRQLAIQAGARTALAVPLIRDDRALGTILVRRTEVRAFEDKHITLLKTFADQAAIAIENARLLNELRQRTDDLSESLEQQTATSEVLQVISSSPGQLQPVFDMLVDSAARLCRAECASIFRLAGGAYHLTAVHGFSEEYRQFARHNPIPPGRNSVVGRTALEGRTVHIPDCMSDAEYNWFQSQEIAGFRTVLGVPLLHEGAPIGVITLTRSEVRPFTDKQIELVQNFASQAVIAIENVRLFNELRQRTGDLTESLEQQTATSEVLKVISSSPGDLEPVFQAMMANATRICEASYGVMLLREGENLRAAAIYGALPAAFTEQWRSGTLFRPDSGILAFRAAATREPVQIADLRASPAYQSGNAMAITGGDVAGIRTMVTVPMLKDNEVVGVIGIYRQEVRPFTDKQIALVTNFAAQAVIAIENTRLLTELRQRTDDLSESLEQQTAISEILRVISVSPGDLQPVFDTVAERAARICEAQNVRIFVVEEGKLRPTAAFGDLEQFERIRNDRMPLNRETVMGRSIVDRQSVHITDLQSTDHDFPLGRELALGLGHRTTMAVPLLHEDRALGTILMRRAEVRPFEDKHIALLKTFANQAAIAIENTRLLSEVRQQASQLEAQSQELRTLNQGLEQRVDEQVGEIERMSRLRRFLPPQVADLIVSSGSEKQLESHRREITALFCDLRGFTGFSETSDPEDVMALLREYHKAIGEIIFRHGGTLERFAGDGVMVIFNDPVPLPNPALSAVQMALEMRAAIGGLIEKWSRLGHELGFGIGISHGYATLGTIGFEGRFDYAAIGTVSNVASRLCDEAAPGQILVSPRVLLAVEDAVSVEPVREMSLKGIRRPMLVHNVVDAKAGAA